MKTAVLSLALLVASAASAQTNFNAPGVHWLPDALRLSLIDPQQHEIAGERLANGACRFADALNAEGEGVWVRQQLAVDAVNCRALVEEGTADLATTQWVLAQQPPAAPASAIPPVNAANSNCTGAGTVTSTQAQMLVQWIDPYLAQAKPVVQQSGALVVGQAANASATIHWQPSVSCAACGGWYGDGQVIAGLTYSTEDSRYNNREYGYLGCSGVATEVNGRVATYEDNALHSCASGLRITFSPVRVIGQPNRTASGSEYSYVSGAKANCGAYLFKRSYLLINGGSLAHLVPPAVPYPPPLPPLPPYPPPIGPGG